MGFLVALFSEPPPRGWFEDALELYPSWSLRQTPQIMIDVVAKHYRIACLTDEQGSACRVWTEIRADDAPVSFVYILGWCNRIDSIGDWPNDEECQRMLDRQRNGWPPVDESYSGNYVVVVYDSESRKIVIQPDRWAMGAIYYSASQKCIAVSNRSTMVASLVSSPLDGYSILSLLRATHMPFGRTLFSDVHRVMCGCYLEIDTSPMRLQLKRASPVYVPVEEKNLSEGAENIGETLCNMAQRWSGLRGGAIFDLTGGNDTRLTAAALLHENPRGPRPNFAWCVAGDEDDGDVRIATTIAQACRWPLLRLSMEIVPDAPLEWVQKAILQADGTCLVDWACLRTAQEFNRGSGSAWHIGSIGGELLRGFFWRHQFLSIGKTNRVDYSALIAYRLYASRHVDSKILGERAPSLSEHDEVLLKPYTRIGELGVDAVNAYKLDAMYMHKLCCTVGSTQSWLAGLRKIQLPLVCWEFSKESLSLPWKLRTSRRLMLKIINNLAPQLANIPNDKGELMKPLTVSTLPFYMKSSVVSAVTTLPRIANRYARSFGPRRNMSKVEVPISWIPIAQESRHIHSIFDSGAIKDVCSKVKSGSNGANLARAFYTMVTLELLLTAIPNVSHNVEFNAGPEIPG